VDVTAATGEIIDQTVQFGSGGFVVVVVEALDHVKGPPALEYVTSDQVVPHRAGVAAMTGLVPPVLAARPSVPAASVSFDATRQPVTATARLAAGDVSPGETVLIEMREFAPGDVTGTTIGHATASGSASGHVDIAETVALTPGVRYLSVQVSRVGSPTAPCTPQLSSVAGCTVVSVPTPPTTGTR